jgi:hypothetical protein
VNGFWKVTSAAVLLAAGCKIEQTPQQYFDHREPLSVERQTAVAEVQDRLLAMGRALGRGNPAEALVALAPAPDVFVIGPGDDEILSGEAQVGAALELLAGTPLAVAIRDLEVASGPRGGVTWFRGVMDLPSPDPQRQVLRMSGVYTLFEGSLRLVQLHLSFSAADLTQVPAYRDAAAAPPGDG